MKEKHLRVLQAELQNEFGESDMRLGRVYLELQRLPELEAEKAIENALESFLAAWY